ncbi:MAG: pyrogallol hydroxytransferase large subunit [Gracilibacter sp. BRH_c7a]|nr:MAG: pyrogallol hydroxytransferase large subunit [Gracilibacter sp. BRH_c7a]
MTAKKYPGFAQRLKEKNMVVQIKIMDNSQGRYYVFEEGKVSSKNGIHPQPHVVMAFDNPALAVNLMKINRNQLDFVSAAKDMTMMLMGPDDYCIWFAETLGLIFNAAIVYGGEYGIDMGKGVKRYTSCTNGGPLFVYVKEGKIIRTTPIEFDDKDPQPWTINAKGEKLTPPRKTTNNAHGLIWKSMVYSPDRLLYPMKRVDFDPNGNRNTQNRGISGYERISWDEALDIVSGEIKRVRTVHGPGSVFWGYGSHHTWGNLGYFISAGNRFFNSIGATRILMNPDSWEGWYWGAMHHWGHSAKLGGADQYSTVEDCLQNAEMVVFWSSDPESTSGAYAGHEGTVRREWLKKLGIKVVHIDPHYNHTAAFLGGKWFAPRPGTDAALALAIAYVWITENLYDQSFVENRTIGFDKWRDYILGKEDGITKTPEWQEAETGIPAREARALAQEWGTKKTYLSPGGIPAIGSACRTAYGTEWARSMVCLMAMQGFGKPGVNFGGLQFGTPLSTSFYFPGYTEGGFSGELQFSGSSVNLYQRMPHTPSMNTVNQCIPRLKLPEAFLEEKASAHITEYKSIEGQFIEAGYPTPGHSPARLYYKYGTSFIGTQPDSNRYALSYQTDNIEFVVNQSIWFEGEAKFADVILPACTNLERWDIGEFAHCGGYIDKSYLQNNHRVMFVQHKCIEPLGESKSDFQIYLDIAMRLGLGNIYSEGNSELDWVKRTFQATDVAKEMTFKEFIKKGYYVAESLPENRRAPVAYRWYYEDRHKDVPELTPLPSEYKGQWGKGFQTQSGKFEFECSSLKRYDPNDPERPVICKYIPSWEGRNTTELYEKFPLQLITPHPRYSHHTIGDAKGSYINDVTNHRVLVDGYYYWIVRINPKDAAQRGIKEDDLVEVFNNRGSVICAARLTERIPAGTVHSYESSAKYDPIGAPGKSPDRGGCMNILTPSRMIIKKAHGMGANSCLVEIRSWEGVK